MEHIHTQIQEPLNLRKNILESAIFATEVLRSSDDFVKFNNNNNIFMDQLKESVKQLHGELDRLQSILPPLPDEFNRIEIRPKRMIEVRKPALKIQDSPQYSRNKFDRELEEIRAKMARLMLNR